jgi:hypothetical protein
MFFLTSCGGASLADFASSELSLQLSSDGFVRLSLSDGASDCRTLDPHTRATINGLALSLDPPGGQILTGTGWSCTAPRFSIPAVDLEGPDAHVVLDDGHSRVALEVTNAFVERNLGLVEQARPFTLLWQPGTDQVRSATWKLDDGAGGLFFGEARIEDDLVLFELPEGRGEAGTLLVDGQAFAPVTECSGVLRCVVRVSATSGELHLSAVR